MAIDRIIFRENQTGQYTEQLAQRLYGVRLLVDPVLFDDCSPEDPCNEHNSLRFDLSVTNHSSSVKDVLAKDLVWIPQGDQAKRFGTVIPRVKIDNLLIARLQPGKTLSLQAYFLKGQGRSHAKWRQVLACYRPLSNGHYEFTLELQGGLTFEQIQAQVQAQFSCPPKLLDYHPSSYVKPINVEVISQELAQQFLDCTKPTSNKPTSTSLLGIKSSPTNTTNITKTNDNKLALLSSGHSSNASNLIIVPFIE